MRKQLRNAYSTHCAEEYGLENPHPEQQAVQADKESCDINNIMAKYQQTGVIDHVREHGARYADATGVEFNAAMQLIANAQTMFEELPSSARNHFENDPARFLDYVNGLDEIAADPLLIELGLSTRKPREKTTGETPENKGSPTDPGATEESPPIDPT